MTHESSKTKSRKNNKEISRNRSLHKGKSGNGLGQYTDHKHRTTQIQKMDQRSVELRRRGHETMKRRWGLHIGSHTGPSH